MSFSSTVAGRLAKWTDGVVATDQVFLVERRSKMSNIKAALLLRIILSSHDDVMSEMILFRWKIRLILQRLTTVLRHRTMRRMLRTQWNRFVENLG